MSDAAKLRGALRRIATLEAELAAVRGAAPDDLPKIAAAIASERIQKQAAQDALRELMAEMRQISEIVQGNVRTDQVRPVIDVVREVHLALMLAEPLTEALGADLIAANARIAALEAAAELEEDSLTRDLVHAEDRAAAAERDAGALRRILDAEPDKYPCGCQRSVDSDGLPVAWSDPCEYHQELAKTADHWREATTRAFRLADELGALARLPFDCDASRELRALRALVEPGWRPLEPPAEHGTDSTDWGRVDNAGAVEFGRAFEALKRTEPVDDSWRPPRG